MQKHIKIYKELLEEINLLQKEVAFKVGWSEWKMSRFLNGNDVKAEEFFSLLSVMPESFQKKFWHRFLNLGSDIDVSSLSSSEAANLLNAIADRLQLLEISQQVKVG